MFYWRFAEFLALSLPSLLSPFLSYLTDRALFQDCIGLSIWRMTITWSWRSLLVRSTSTLRKWRVAQATLVRHGSCGLVVYYCICNAPPALSSLTLLCDTVFSFFSCRDVASLSCVGLQCLHCMKIPFKNRYMKRSQRLALVRAQPRPMRVFSVGNAFATVEALRQTGLEQFQGKRGICTCAFVTE